MKNKGIGKLAQSLDDRMRALADKPPSLDLGTIEAGGGLKLDGFGVSLPPTEYLVSAWLLDVRMLQSSRVVAAAAPVQVDGSPIEGITETVQTRMDFLSGDDAGHVPRIEANQLLQQGDRVLVAWVGADAVVLSKVVSGSG